MSELARRVLSVSRRSPRSLPVILVLLLALAGISVESGRPVPDQLDSSLSRASTPASGSTDCPAAAPDTAPNPERTRQRLAALKLVSYFPAGGGWGQMWSHWQPTVIEADFARIQDLGANAVRLVLDVQEFGYPLPREPMLERLAEAVGLAHRHGLDVQLTLFDGWDEYEDIGGSIRWAERVLAPFTNDQRLAFVELQNEIDPTDARAIAWARAVLPCIQRLSGEIPVTVSISGKVGLTGLRQLVAASLPVDFYSLHYYDRPELAYATFAEASQIVGNVPLFIGETGYSTALTGERTATGYDLVWWEAYQDQYYRAVEYAAAALRLPAPAPWIAFDLHQYRLPLLETGELYYGLYRPDGTAKPAASSIEAIFETGVIDATFNNGFESATGTGRPTNWKLWAESAALFDRDATVARSGQASARIRRSRGTQDALPAYYVSPVEPIVPGRTYTASVWVAGLNATGVTQLTLAWFDADGSWLRNDSSPGAPPGTFGWTRLDVSVVAPQDAAFVEIHLQSGWNSGAVWFDDVSFD